MLALTVPAADIRPSFADTERQRTRVKMKRPAWPPALLLLRDIRRIEKKGEVHLSIYNELLQPHPPSPCQPLLIPMHWFKLRRGTDSDRVSGCDVGYDVAAVH